MQQTWRWFGPDDPVTLADMKQAGAYGVVTALHHMNTGGAWTDEEVLKRKAMIESHGLTWAVVESIGVGEEIKTRTGDFKEKIDNYKKSIRAVARAGVKTICYNFMAITDWTRTDLVWKLPTGGYALRFDAVDFAAYDVFVLKRAGAAGDYTPERLKLAEARFKSFTDEKIKTLEHNLIDWLPARDATYDRPGFLKALDVYKDISPDDLRANLVDFLREVVPVAEEDGARMCIHADDPSFPIFGLPRVMSTADDVRKMFAAVPQTACGLTLCSGSFGSNLNNNLPEMAKEFASRIHFVHLRNTTHEPDGSFYEAEHLEGDTDIISVAAAIIAEEARRKAEGREDHQIPVRPDHGHLILDDVGKKVNPGYSCIGRLKGLAEIRGVMKTIEAYRAGRIV